MLTNSFQGIHVVNSEFLILNISEQLAKKGAYLVDNNKNFSTDN